MIIDSHEIVRNNTKGWEVVQTGEDGQRVQTSGYKMNKHWGCNVQHGDYS